MVGAARMFRNKDLRGIRLSEQAKNLGSALQENVGLWVACRSVRAKYSSFRGIAQRHNRPPLSLGISERTEFHFGKLNMPIRGHASPRRGNKHGGRGILSPRRVSPLTISSPSSQGYVNSDSDTDNSVQIVTFRYTRRTNRPIVSTLITAVFAEEEDEAGKGKGIDEMQKQTPNRSPQGSSLEESSYQPSTRSQPEEDSTGSHEKDQHEALREICSLIDMETSSFKAQNVTEEVKMPERLFGGRLYPVLPPGFRRLEDIPCGMEIDFLPDPEREAEEWEAEQNAAKQKAAEDKAADSSGKE